MEDWPTLPQVARELAVAESTARRWAASFSDLLPTKGHGAARRFHPQTWQVLKRVQTLYMTGLNTTQVAEVLHQEFPVTIDVRAEPVREELVQKQSMAPLHAALTAIAEQQAALQEQLAQMEPRLVQELAETQQRLAAELVTLRTENRQLREQMEAQGAERDRQLMHTMQEVLAERAVRSPRSWWPFKLRK
jgi:DNA-binding transcriptional MerR regulator